MSADDEQMWQPVKPGDVTDLALLPGEMRAFRVEMRDEIRGIANALQSLVRIEQRLDAIVSHQGELDRRLVRVETRLDILESAPITAARIVNRRTTAGKK